ncbi:hypothetical protein Fmac_027488 [Flemingia macrophylla]|uniref:Uncharacterized protein n=1 Tax=Flemingia macrophylla TaxID=520843 RepID=A0ABD1LHX6_9FABA
MDEIHMHALDDHGDHLVGWSLHTLTWINVYLVILLMRKFTVLEVKVELIYSCASGY